MEIRVRFLGGPLDGQIGMTNALSEVKLFFPQDRQILLYIRENETSYVFDIVKSKQLEAVYDEARKRFAPHVAGYADTLRFVNEEVAHRLPPPLPPFSTSDEATVDEEWPDEDDLMR